MSSETCIHACHSPYYRLGEPCVACRRWHNEMMDRSYLDYVREQQGLAVDDAKPATDAEWLVWLETQAPLDGCPKCGRDIPIDTGGECPSCAV